MTPVSALATCREALRRGPLFREGAGWRFHGRLFNFHTVAMLIDAGEAIRLGDCVVAWSPEAVNAHKA